MVLLKKVENSDPGTTDQVGGNDWDKLADYFNNVDVSESPTINNDTLLRQDKFQIRNSANTFGHKHRSLATATRTITYPDTDLTVPTNLDSLTDVAITSPAIGALLRYDGTNWVVLNKGTAGQYFKVNSMGTDTAWETDAMVVAMDDLQDAVITAPSYNQKLTYDGLNWVNTSPPPSENPLIKSGEWYPLTTTDYATGILTDGLVAPTGTLSRTADSKGMRNQITTAAAPASTGLTQSVARYRREYDSRLYCYFSSNTSAASNCQFFFGFSSSATPPASDTPFDSAVSGLFVMLRQVDNGSPPGTYKAVHNDATGSTVVDDTAIAFVTNAYYKFEIVLSATNAKVYINDQLTNTITTDLPAVATPLYPYWFVRTVAGTPKSIFLYKAGIITK